MPHDSPKVEITSITAPVTGEVEGFLVDMALPSCGVQHNPEAQASMPNACKILCNCYIV